jgi:hypothetical protein
MRTGERRRDGEACTAWMLVHARRAATREVGGAADGSSDHPFVTPEARGAHRVTRVAGRVTTRCSSFRRKSLQALKSARMTADT